MSTHNICFMKKKISKNYNQILHLNKFISHVQILVQVSKYVRYSKCTNILNTKMSDKMIYTNNADPDQTAPEGAV